MHPSSMEPMPKILTTGPTRFCSALLLNAIVFCGLMGCEPRVAPTREWQPSDHGQPTQADPARTPPQEAESEEGGTERAADALYNVTCSGCHGRDGKGQGPQRPPGASVPDFTDSAFQAARTDVQLMQVLREGRGLMPPFGKQLNDHGLDALIAKVRRFGSGDAVPKAAEAQ